MIPLMNAMTAWGINTPIRMAAFFAQIAKESGFLSTFTENLNYSADGLAKTWPKRYAVNPKAAIKVPNDLAQRLHRNPEQIANHTYANRMGNGSPESGDGWRYRGRGPKQITGKDNYTAYAQVSKYPGILLSPDRLLVPMIGADAAGWFWSTRKCSELIDAGDFRAVTIAINGGLIGYEDGNTTGIDDRVELFENAKQVMLA
jgi:putative chitinase